MAELKFVTDGGAKKKMQFRRSRQVGKTLGCGSGFCGQENTVVFTKTGGAIVKDIGGRLAKEMARKSRGPVVRTCYRPRHSQSHGDKFPCLAIDING